MSTSYWLLEQEAASRRAELLRAAEIIRLTRRPPHDAAGPFRRALASFWEVFGRLPSALDAEDVRPRHTPSRKRTYRASHQRSRPAARRKERTGAR